VEGAVSQAVVEAPEAMVSRFLAALRQGDRETIASLLTAGARQETVRLGYEINVPGDPTAKYEVGRVEPVGDGKNEVFVSSIWTEDLGEGQVHTFEAVWICKREDQGWRISGLAIQDPASGEPLVFDFEKLEEVFKKMEQMEQPSPEGGETVRQAANPGESGEASLPVE
jgi:hypothetical protein